MKAACAWDLRFTERMPDKLDLTITGDIRQKQAQGVKDGPELGRPSDRACPFSLCQKNQPIGRSAGVGPQRLTAEGQTDMENGCCPPVDCEDQSLWETHLCPRWDNQP